jgi:hypothetical protein
MDNVQKHDICITVLSSQIFRSYGWLFQNYVQRPEPVMLTHRVINGKREHAVYTMSTVNVQSGSFTSFWVMGRCLGSQENHILLQNGI